MGETSVVPTTAASAAGGAKATGMGYLAAHPVGVAVVGGILIGVGAYYLGKSIANRAKRKKAEEAVAPATA